MRKWTAALVSLVAGLAAGGAVLVTPAAAASAPYCGIRWGSTAEQAAGSSAAPLVNVRAGRHACYDRLVLDVRGDARGYRVEYVSQVRTDGAGVLVPLRGGAKLQIVSRSPAYDINTGRATYTPRNRAELVNVAGFRTFRQVAWAGSFEGQTTVGLGVRARLPFRVFVLDGPGSGSRLVIDVAHRW